MDSLPPGCEYHIAGGGGEEPFVVAEVWESADAMDTFTQTTLVPASHKVGLPPPTSVTVAPLLRHRAP